MSKKQSILYINAWPPCESDSSAIVMRRHLERFADQGFDITVAYLDAHAANSKIPEKWEQILLPSRKWFYPPIRSWLPFSGSFRMSLLSWHICRNLKSSPTVIVSVLWPTYAIIARNLSTQLNAPLILLSHDDPCEWVNGISERRKLNRELAAVARYAKKVLAVSRRLSERFPVAALCNAAVLRPIPASVESSSPPNKSLGSQSTRRPTIAYSGTIYWNFLDTLAQIATQLENVGWDLVVVCHHRFRNYDTNLWSMPNVKFVEFFETSDMARDYLKMSADAILVAHPENEPRLRDSFPSKLVDFSHLGLPIIILCPIDCALGDWVLERNWPAFADIRDKEQTATLIGNLSSDEFLAACRSAVQEAAEGEFNPDKIHQQFWGAICECLEA